MGLQIADIFGNGKEETIKISDIIFCTPPPPNLLLGYLFCLLDFSEQA